MFKIFTHLAAIVLLALMAEACGGGNSPTLLPTDAAAEAVELTLTTNPDPPKSGHLELIVTLTDPAGRPLHNASVNVLASHKTMSGMNMQGAATAQGNGRYAITADFGMSGQWLVTVEVRAVSADPIRKDFDLSLK